MATVEDRALASKTSLNDDIGEETRLRLYRLQVEIREAEQRAFDLFLQNLVKGLSHLSRPRPYARARRADREGAGRIDAARQWPDARQRRLDASDLGRSRRHGL